MLVVVSSYAFHMSDYNFSSVTVLKAKHFARSPFYYFSLHKTFSAMKVELFSRISGPLYQIPVLLFRLVPIAVWSKHVLSSAARTLG
jgi:hypothetical protein